MNNEDLEWVNNAIADFQNQEIEALRRLKEAQADWINARSELAAARDFLKGARGCLKEMLWQKQYLEANGKLP